ncbi:[acyl-carrier-protein] S-malonyltransferase [Exiguobacterium sp. SH3S2]|uniref:ACP S-malonyltransferase n=1 Tax=Exiguobacterium TaxID=33986 RepID=UPI000877876C|nr:MULTISPECIES: ACP S-malonyltransferase [Exiguobacterium]OGX77973.1 malonyl CoA-acyl carrier protein transacylase [Exiguobacterium sp. SH31]TCI27466.1 [acyl-carrier-protein] S-malonyltransferase [Exiguobacterium sp. SH5S4]TCI45513.1 [acyl-carrier-protein] S-malonyltransferase [Exiguobacterium sp. SH5S32]TCI49211.1 [acyl-carrier-protein] S-malonyltransferase [Exiguobacterium sp. SH3S3]TCI52714.1 [acyl-carrier-protein] S-malonyltransferase [Exiguobacterium sp. SH1S4]
MREAWIFPGQGSQTVGMGQTFLDDPEQMQAIDRRLGFDLLDVMAAGSKEELQQTEVAQPAIVAHAALLALAHGKTGAKPDVVIGHSVGEYAALVVAGVIDLEEACVLVRERGKLMSEVKDGTMAAVIGMTDVAEAFHLTEKISASGNLVQIANYNCPGQFVISGHVDAVKQAETDLKQAGAKRVLPLDVSGAFHSSYMMPAATRFKDVLASSPFKDATIGIISNVDAAVHTDAEKLKALLTEQLYASVRFEDCVRKAIAEGVDTFIEFGSTSPLSGLIKRIDKNVTLKQVTTLEEVAALGGEVRA